MTEESAGDAPATADDTPPAADDEPRAATEGAERQRETDGSDARDAVERSDTEETTERPDTGAGPTEHTEPPETFAALSDPTRLRAVRTVAEAIEPPTFTDLFEASGADTTAGFAYHLRQLTGRYLRKSNERYHLTYAGRRLARALDAGTFTDRVNRDPAGIDGDCPICDEAALAAAVGDNVVAIARGGCETELLALPFPPNGVADRPTTELVAAFDGYHRARLSLVADGVCPDCAGAAAARIELRDNPAIAAGERPVADCACEDCGFRLRVPVSLLLLDHPEVRRFAAEEEIALADRPLWNLGPEWSERVVSDDPVAVAVSITGETERLELLVGDGPVVPRVRRESGGGVVDTPDTNGGAEVVEVNDARSSTENPGSDVETGDTESDTER